MKPATLALAALAGTAYALPTPQITVPITPGLPGLPGVPSLPILGGGQGGIPIVGPLLGGGVPIVGPILGGGLTHLPMVGPPFRRFAKSAKFAVVNKSTNRLNSVILFVN